MLPISGHQDVAGVTNIQPNHKQAAHLALKHLADLGHRRIAFMRGQEKTVDTDYRWREIMQTACAFGLEVHQDLLIKLTENSRSPFSGVWPGEGPAVAYQEFHGAFSHLTISLLSGPFGPFTKLGSSVPQDVSVIGFDDVLSAPFRHSQPNHHSPAPPRYGPGGRCRITAQPDQSPRKAPYAPQVIMEPELVIRESTARWPRASLLRLVKAAQSGFARSRVIWRWSFPRKLDLDRAEVEVETLYISC